MGVHCFPSKSFNFFGDPEPAKIANKFIPCRIRTRHSNVDTSILFDSIQQQATARPLSHPEALPLHPNFDTAIASSRFGKIVQDE